VVLFDFKDNSIVKEATIHELVIQSNTPPKVNMLSVQYQIGKESKFSVENPRGLSFKEASNHLNEILNVLKGKVPEYWVPKDYEGFIDKWRDIIKIVQSGGRRTRTTRKKAVRK
jgi:hypothetical protein